MTLTIDKAGRVVIPKAVRDELGLREGTPLTLTTDGVGIRIEPAATGGRVIEENGRLVVVSSAGRKIADEEIRAVIDAGRR